MIQSSKHNPDRYRQKIVREESHPSPDKASIPFPLVLDQLTL
jgi:hypothetical protein